MEAASVSAALARLIRQAIERNGGWLPFDRFMAMALYAPGLGYYANAGRKFGALARRRAATSSPRRSCRRCSARCWRARCAQALEASGTDEVWEFGAGSGRAGRAAARRARRRGAPLRDRRSVRRAARAPARAARGASAIDVEWVDALPTSLSRRRRRQRGARCDAGAAPPAATASAGSSAGWPATASGFVFADRPTALRPPLEAALAMPDGSTIEMHAQAEAFVATLAERLEVAARPSSSTTAFPAHEYYHPQRSGGTLMCHRAHLRRPRPADRRRREGHHRARRLHRHRAGRARRPGSTCSATRRRRASS